MRTWKEEKDQGPKLVRQREHRTGRIGVRYWERRGSSARRTIGWTHGGPGSRKLAMRDSSTNERTNEPQASERTNRRVTYRSEPRFASVQFGRAFASKQRTFAFAPRASPPRASYPPISPFGRPLLRGTRKAPSAVSLLPLATTAAAAATTAVAVVAVVPLARPLPCVSRHGLGSRLASSTHVAEPLSSAITSRYFALSRVHACVDVCVYIHAAFALVLALVRRSHAYLCACARCIGRRR